MEPPAAADPGGRAWRRWAVAAMGVALGALAVAHLRLDDGAGAGDTVEVLLPLAAAVAVTALGVRLARGDAATPDLAVVARWTAGGAAAVGALGLWVFYLSVREGLPADEVALFAGTAAAVGGLVGAVLGVYDVRRRRSRRAAERGERAIRALHDASTEMGDVATSAELAQRTVDVASRVIDLPFTVLWAYDPETDALEPAAMTEATRERLADAGRSELRTMGADSPGMASFRAGETRSFGDPPTDSGTPAAMGFAETTFVPVGDYGLLGVGTPDEGGIDDGRLRLVELLANQAAAEFERVEHNADMRRRQRAIEALHERTRGMVTATDPEAVAERVVAAASEVLELPLTAVWLADETGERLEPAAWTDEAAAAFGSLPTYAAGQESISWRAYATGEARLVEDVGAEPGAHDPDSPSRSELVVPLGEHGVLNAGAERTGAFGPEDLQLANLLAANAVAALERVDRERQLRRRNSQMEFFNSILRHDVLNGMTVIRSRGEVLADELEGTHGSYAATIVEWCDDVVDVVARVRTVLETLTGEATHEPERVDLAATVAAEADRVRRTYPGIDLAVDVPDDATVMADELLTEVVGNLLTNAVEHNDPADLRVRVTADVGEQRVALRVADDGQGIPDDRKDVVFRRGETAHAKSTGSGFGLFFVDSMVEEYGGEVRVEDSDMGGAAFVLELPRPTEPSPFRRVD